MPPHEKEPDRSSMCLGAFWGCINVRKGRSETLIKSQKMLRYLTLAMQIVIRHSKVTRTTHTHTESEEALECPKDEILALATISKQP
jgi:hypothetical protein